LEVASRYDCVVSIGYPEITRTPSIVPEQIHWNSTMTTRDVCLSTRSKVNQMIEEVDQDMTTNEAESNYYMFNSTLTVSPDGRVLAHYRKTHLYYTDAVWASPSLTGFTTVPLALDDSADAVRTSFGICMDINPQFFTADWTSYELAKHTSSTRASLLVISTAWLTRLPPDTESSLCCPALTADDPDLDTFVYWLERLTPLINSDSETLAIFANRVGFEPGNVKACDLEKVIRPSFRKQLNQIGQSTSGNSHPKGSDHMREFTKVIEDAENGVVSTSAHYAGTSAVFTVGRGKIKLWNMLGRGVEDVLIADTMGTPKHVFVLRAREAEDNS
jgi:hypothetical protein